MFTGFFYMLYPRLFFAKLQILFLMLVLSTTTFAFESLKIPRVNTPPILADYVDGLPMEIGVKVSGFRQYEPGDGEASALETNVYFSYDDDNFYAVFVCKDDPNLVRARIAKREDLIGDDAVQLYIDSFHDKQRAFRFLVNPYGVQMDAKQTEGIGPDFEFDTQWGSDGQITDSGYVALMSIPFKSLRFRKESIQDWGIAVGRIIPRLNEFSHWPYITSRKEAFIPQFASATIENSVSPGRNIQLIPYASYFDSRVLNKDDASAPYWQEAQETEVGLDAKFVLADSFALDLTFNPDFSQVETDDPQVLIDKRFEQYSDEKRPFFLENASFFTTPQYLFYSRRVQDPEYGARITGQSGNWSLGGLLIDDESPSSIYEGDTDYGKTAKIGVARVQRDFGHDSNLGVMLTHRTVGQQSNQVFGIDSRYAIDENWIVTGQVAKSQNEEATQKDWDGNFLFAEVTHGGRNFNYTGNYLDVSERFDTSLGFVPRVDIKQTYHNAAYLWNFSDRPWLLSMGPALSLTGTWDQEGELQDRVTDASFNINGLRTTSLSFHLVEGFEHIAGLDFDKQGFKFEASSEWFSWLTAYIALGQNETINYRPAEGLFPFLGDSREVEVTFKFNPTTQFRVEQTLYWNDLKTKDNLAGQSGKSNVYRDMLSRTKFSYQYNRFLAGHIIVDYNTLASNTALYNIDTDNLKQLGVDIQLSYVLSPSSAVYLGYSDRQENVRLIGNPEIVERTDDLDVHIGEQFYLKFSYLFQQ